MFQLNVTSWCGPDEWEWALSDGAGEILASHRVKLRVDDPAASRVLNLYENRWRFDTDKRGGSEDEQLRQLGRYISQELFGPIAAALSSIEQRTVPVYLPPGTEGITSFPLELALVGDDALPLQPLTLCYCPDPPGAAPAPASLASPPGTLRILAVFSSPAEAMPLPLPAERQALVDLLGSVTAASPGAAELRVLQYGVTRDRLRVVLQEDEGWDVVHFSGHGEAGTVLLEGADERGDPVLATDFVALLVPTASRLKMVVLSACESGAEVRDAMVGGGHLPGVGCAIAEAMDCAVIAMRYPVRPDFATRLTTNLYSRLLQDETSLDRALAEALLASVADRTHSSLDLATPILIGERALALEFDLHTATEASGAPARLDGRRTRRGTPKPSPLFVGNQRSLPALSGIIRADAAPGNALVVGMPAVGKTSCVLELVQVHGTGYQSVTWVGLQRPNSRYHPAQVVLHSLQSQLAPHQRRRWSPAEAAEQFRGGRNLLVIDDVERHLIADGRWSDPDLGLLIDLVTRANSRSSVVLISDRIIPSLGPRMRTVPITCLSKFETSLLEQAHDAARPAGAPRQQWSGGGGLTRLVLWGHPGLIGWDFAAPSEKAAARRLFELERSWQVLRPRPVESPNAVPAGGPARSITSWAAARTDQLGPDERFALTLLAALEPVDRQTHLIERGAELTGAIRERQPVDLGSALEDLAAHGLIERLTSGSNWYGLHPAVAAAVRKSDESLTRDVAVALGAFWTYTSSHIDDGDTRDDASTEALARSIPYRLRLGDWPGAFAACEIVSDRFQIATGRLLPFLNTLYELSEDRKQQVAVKVIRARVISRVAKEEGRKLLIAAYHEALELGLQAEALAAAQAVAQSFADDLPAASGWIEKAIAADAELSSNEWIAVSMLLDQARVVELAGAHEEAKGLARRALEGIDGLPARENAAVDPDSMRMQALQVIAAAASGEGNWAEEAETDQRIFEELKRRGFPRDDTARAQLNLAPAMVRAKDFVRARQWLLAAKAEFDRMGDEGPLSQALRLLAECDYGEGYVDGALVLAKQALRASYAAMEPVDASALHEDLAIYYGSVDSLGQAALHILAAAVIGARMGTRMLVPTPEVIEHLGLLSLCLAHAPGLVLGTYEELRAAVAADASVDIEDLIGGLPRAEVRQDPVAGRLVIVRSSHGLEEDPVSDALSFARVRVPPTEILDVKYFPQHWGPIRDAISLAATGDRVAGEQIRKGLERLRAAGWGDVARAIDASMRGEAIDIEPLDPVGRSVIQYLDLTPASGVVV